MSWRQAGTPFASLTSTTIYNIFNGQAVSTQLQLFGDGADGDVTFDGAATVLGFVPAANVYTLTRSIYTRSVTVAVGVTVITDGYQWFNSGTLTNNGTIQCNGKNATSSLSGNGGGKGGGTRWYLPGSDGGASSAQSSMLPAPWGATIANPAGGVGGVGGVGGNGGAPPGGSLWVGGGGGGGGAAGDGNNGGVGGVGGGTTVVAGVSFGGSPWDLFVRGEYNQASTTQLRMGGCGGARGGTGGGGVGSSPGNSGQGGGGGGVCAVFSYKVTGTGTISANGGDGFVGGNATDPGGHPNAGGGGGGAGGAGGSIILVYATRAGTLTVSANGGAGKAGGNPIGTGFVGGSGPNGGAGKVWLMNTSGDGT